RPKSPNDTLAPRVATPVLRPFCSLRNFLRAGCSIFYSPLPSALGLPSAAAAGVGALRTRLTAGAFGASAEGAALGAAAAAASTGLASAPAGALARGGRSPPAPGPAERGRPPGAPPGPPGR